MNPEDLVVGGEYTWKEHLDRGSFRGDVFVYVGPDNFGWVFRKKGTREYRNFSGGIGNLRPKPEPFFEEGKTYVQGRRRFKVETVRDSVAFGYLTGEPSWYYPPGGTGRWGTRNSADWEMGWTEQ